MAIGFYSLGTLDLLGTVDTATNEADRESWKEWIWDQQSSSFRFLSALIFVHMDMGV
jgi:hypothetical protein